LAGGGPGGNTPNLCGVFGPGGGGVGKKTHAVGGGGGPARIPTSFCVGAPRGGDPKETKRFLFWPPRGDVVLGGQKA